VKLGRLELIVTLALALVAAPLAADAQPAAKGYRIGLARELLADLPFDVAPLGGNRPLDS